MSNNNQMLYIISALAASQKVIFYAQNYNSPSEFFEADDQSLYNATLTLLIATSEEIKKMDTKILATQSHIQ